MIYNNCCVCKKSFLGKSSKGKYCSNKCRQLERKKRIELEKKLNPQKFIDRNKIGYIKSRKKIGKSFLSDLVYVCQFCNQQFKPREIHQICCSKKCGNENRRQRMKNSIQCQIRQGCSIYILGALKRQNVRKTDKTLQLLGCSIKELKLHLEKQFKPGMSWNTHRLFGWHIDHIKPCSLFDLTKKEEQQKCFHYTNLQPLWWYENLQKSNKYNG